MTITTLKPRPIVRTGDALYIESTVEGQIKTGPFAYSLAEIVKFLGDDATLISHREGNEYRDRTEELAEVWLTMHMASMPFEEDCLPAYVANSDAWKLVRSQSDEDYATVRKFGTYERQHRVNAQVTL